MHKITIGYLPIADWAPGPLKWTFPEWYYDTDDPAYDPKFAVEVAKNAPDEVVLLPSANYVLKIEYPLKKPCKIKFNSGSSGMTRLALAEYICVEYRRIYAEEDATITAIVGQIPGMFNRSATTGKYGIWGHDIGDLMLHTAYVAPDGVITLGVDS
jgi:hypothetical protein